VAPVAPRPTRVRAQDFFDAYTKDLNAGDLQRLFTRDAREAYAFFARGIDRESLDRLPWHIRLVTHIKLFLLAFMLRLSPARRALYGAALVASILGVIGLFNGFQIVRLDPIPLAYPLPSWRDGTLMVVTGFVLLNLLVIMEVADRLSLKHDLNIAREIQLAMLPSGTYRAPGIEIHGETRPANTVGGDFYDLIPQADGRVLVALGDVAGKGSPAALLMALLLAILRTLVDEGLDLPTLATRLNSQVTRHAPPSRFITLFLGMYDPVSDQLTWLNAGQNPPMIRRASGEWVKLAATGVALGMFEGSPYEAETTTLGSGDVLVMYSDGITEAETSGGVPFDEQGLQAVVTAWVGGSAPELSAAVLRSVYQHVGDARVADDLTVLVLKRQ
jgi:sigma-B regulation protein RsbU (phosphoserine phosphatase)